VRTRTTSRPANRSVCVIGPGTRFISGITYYTYGLANALATTRPVSVVLLRRLLPARLYPGARRVGARVSSISLRPEVSRFDGVDWYWVPSLARAIAFLVRRRPHVLVLQWWTATALHTYLVIAAVARRLGADVVIEFHEVLDTGEDRLGPVRTYAGFLAPRLFRSATGSICHSEFERDAVARRFGLDRDQIAVVPHAASAPYEPARPIRTAPDGVVNVLWFGIIRPFKGVEDLIRAFDGLEADEAARYWLTIVGETWEGWDLPARLIEQSRYRDRITFVNRYVRDDEVDGYFRGADVVALPYRRSSQSGPLHVALAYELPVVVTGVGGLTESVKGYEGAVVVPPRDPNQLRDGLRRAAALVGRPLSHDRDWVDVALAYGAAIDSLTRSERAPV
jgi:glycosyltransferase involved in cell wall biosynthesis